MRTHSESPRQVVATAVQDLVATRLGRGFLPLAILFVIGVGEQVLADGFGSPVLAAGSLAAAATMLAYGLRISQRAFARPHRAWMSCAMAGSLVPFAFSLYVLGWRGLRQLALGGGAAGFGVGIAFAWLGTWAMRSWMKVVEVERLAKVMTTGLEE